VSLDFITDLPETPQKHDSLLVLVDKLTKFVRLIPTRKDATAVDTARLLIEHVFANHGFPKVLISDRDPKFTSAVWTAFCGQLGIKRALSTAYHPQTDGQTERMNRVVEEVIRHYIDEEHTSWEALLPCVSFSINNAVSASTGYSPFYLNYGRHPLTPVAVGVVGAAHHRLPAVERVFRDMDEAISRVKLHLKDAQEAQKAYADAKRAPHSCEEGGSVWLSTRNLKFKKGVRKFSKKAIGPFKILKMIGQNAAKLALPAQYRRMHPVFHVSLLRPVKAKHMPVAGASSEQPVAGSEGEPSVEHLPDLMVDGLPWFEIESIREHRYEKKKYGRKGPREYLVRWKNYDASYDEWLKRKDVTEVAEQAYLLSPFFTESERRLVAGAQAQRVAAQAKRVATQAERA
jgi:hypothetical protein